MSEVQFRARDSSTLSYQLPRRKDGQNEAASATVGLIAGSLEGSNVNVVDEMTNLIRLQRQFETQVKIMKTAEENDEAQTQLLRIS